MLLEDLRIEMKRSKTNLITIRTSNSPNTMQEANAHT